MSFSTETKNELARVISESLCCKKAELSGIAKLAGSIQIAGYKKINLKISTELNSVARKVFKVLKTDFNINTSIVVNKNQMLKRNNSYVLTVKSDMGSEELMKTLGLLNKDEDFLPCHTVPLWVYEDEECKKAFIRGAFLGGGSISDPEKNYHLEFVTSNEEFAESLIQIAGYKKINLKISTELNSVARKVFKALKTDFNINTSIVVNKNQMLKRNNSYVLTVKSDMGSEELMKTLGLLDKDEDFLPCHTVPSWVYEDEECKKAFIRGAFLGGGSISDPEKNYHLEFVTSNEEFAESLMNLINSLGLNSKIVCRKNSYVVYLKESEQISDLLSLIGGFQALLSLQNTKILKQMRNDVNRIVNCETANLSKTVNAAVRQVENIKLIQKKMGISRLPESLQQIALLRVENEDLTLKELGELLNPPISKSGVNHRLKKIEDIANELRNKEFDSEDNNED